MTSASPDLSTLWRLRYRHGEKPADLPDNAVIRSLMGHRSVRAYLPDPLPEGALEAAIAAAQSAATSSNLQTWSVVAVEDQARRDRMAVLAGNQAHISAAPLLLVWIADLSRLRRLAEAAGKTSEALDYTESFLVAVIDAALAAQNATDVFESLGLGTVYIGGLRNHPEEVAREIGLAPLAFPVFGLCVGRPDPAHPASIKPRLPQSAIFHRETYDVSDEAGLVAQYDNDANSFEIEQGRPARAWSATMVRRNSSTKGLYGREVIRAVIERLGFLLK